MHTEHVQASTYMGFQVGCGVGICYETEIVPEIVPARESFSRVREPLTSANFVNQPLYGGL